VVDLYFISIITVRSQLGALWLRDRWGWGRLHEFAPGDTEPAVISVLLANISTFFGGAIIAIAGEMIDFSRSIEPHHGVRRTMCFGGRFVLELCGGDVDSGCRRRLGGGCACWRRP
jgi:hypothetical protein